MVECLICGQASPNLPRHVWFSHLSELDSQMHESLARIGGRVCWCGGIIYPTSEARAGPCSRFWDHCSDHGGYFVHYLECKLGVNRG
jgi:hypothetical protein